MLLEDQRAYQRKVYGIDPYELHDEELTAYLRMNALAAVNELMEALNEVPNWKEWRREDGAELPDALPPIEFGQELADSLMFVLNMFLAAGFSDHDLNYLVRQTRAKCATRAVTELS